MPLHRHPENRIRPMMLPFIVLSSYIGVMYVFGDEKRFSAPSFHTQLSIAPIEFWGAMFLAGGGVMVASMLARSTKFMQASLYAGGVIYTWWGLLFLISAVQDPMANPNGFALYMFAALFHFLGAAPYLLNRLLYGKEDV